MSSSSATSRRPRSLSASSSASSSTAPLKLPPPSRASPPATARAPWLLRLCNPATPRLTSTKRRPWPRPRSSTFLKSSGPMATSSARHSGRRASVTPSLPQHKPRSPPFSSAKNCPTAQQRLASSPFAPSAARSLRSCSSAANDSTRDFFPICPLLPACRSASTATDPPARAPNLPLSPSTPGI